MAHKDIEVEIKLPVDESTFLSVKNKLKNTAAFVKNKREVDDYFTPAHRNFLSPQFPFEWLRLRKQDNSVIFTYKHYYPENAEIDTHCDEFESEIKNPEIFGKILKALDFKKLITVDKFREAYRTADFEFALDKVEELGYFIEIEALKDLGGVSATRERLFEAARNLGINISTFDKRGYPYLLLKKKGLLK
jgi:adenylate cyclase class 2